MYIGKWVGSYVYDLVSNGTVWKSLVHPKWIIRRKQDEPFYEYRTIHYSIKIDWKIQRMIGNSQNKTSCFLCMALVLHRFVMNYSLKIKNLSTYLIKTIDFKQEIQAFKFDKLAAKILWQLCAAMMSWVDCLQRDSELFLICRK